MMSTSKSIVLKKFGDYDSLSIESFPLPPLKGRIEVEVHFCGLNFSDVYTRLGFLSRQLPFVLGSECTGIIKNIGITTDSFKIGQHVLCYNYLGGMYSDIIRVLPEEVFPLPDYIPLRDGAGIFVNYLTAYFAVCGLGSLKPGETILINSCAGGVGMAATQLAKNIDNVKIYGTCSPSKETSVEANGVLKVFRYEDLAVDLKIAEPRGVDVIIDNQAENVVYDNVNLLAPLGRIVIIGNNTAIYNNKLSYFSMLKMWGRSWWFSLKDLVVETRSISGLHLGTLLQKDREKVVTALNYIFNLYKQRKIELKLDSIWPIEEYVTASKLLSERKNIGKVLIEVKRQG